MFNIDLQSRIPVWEQIVKMIEKYIQLGILSPGDKLPSVRELTQQIGINPNTVQKAMNDLSMMGYNNIRKRSRFVCQPQTRAQCFLKKRKNDYLNCQL